MATSIAMTPAHLIRTTSEPIDSTERFTMAVQILSDLHLESPKGYDIFHITPNAPYLALLGDVGNIAFHQDDYFAFLKTQLKQFRVVLLVPGNHEAYDSSWDATINTLRQFEKQVLEDDSIGDFVLLDRRSFQIPDTNIIILGCSLFSYVPADKEMVVSMGLNDFLVTNDWDVKKHNEAHKWDLAWLNAEVAQLEDSDNKVIIFSHWSPSLDPRSFDPRHAGSAITSAFSTDLSDETCFKSDKVKIWAFGHTHFNCDFHVKRNSSAAPLRLLTNQRGYYFAQADGFDGEKLIEI